MTYKYLMDSNVLATSDLINLLDTDFFHENCIVINEVAYELSDTSFVDKLMHFTTPPTASMLENLKTIIDDLVKLGIVKTDHGNGDALLIAEALSMKNSSDDQLIMEFMRDQPVIVTNEKAVDAYAKSVGIEAINGREFMNIFNETINKVNQ